MKTHDAEVPAKARRRRFTAEYKQKILREAERCRKLGEIGALLRREGLDSSHLTVWRAARASGERAGLEAKRRGTKPRVRDGQAQRVAELEREMARWKARAERAEFLVDSKKKWRPSWASNSTRTASGADAGGRRSRAARGHCSRVR